MRRLLGTVAVALATAVVVAACGSSGTPRSTEAFCTRLADLRERNPLADAATSDQAAGEVAGVLDDLIRTAPQQIKEDLRTFRRLVDQARALDPADPAAAQQALTQLVSPSVLESGRSLAAFARDQCGFDDVFVTGGG